MTYMDRANAKMLSLAETLTILRELDPTTDIHEFRVTAYNGALEVMNAAPDADVQFQNEMVRRITSLRDNAAEIVRDRQSDN